MINNNNWCQSDFIVVNSNMNYVISNSNLVDITGYYEISEYNENYEWIRSRQTGTKEAKEVAFTILENTKYIRAGHRTDKGLENIKIEQGTVATPYSPYGMGSITDKIVNGNLVEKNIKGYINRSGFMLIDNDSESFVFWAEQGKTYNYSCLKSTNRGRCAKSETINIVNGTPLTNIRDVSNSFTSNFTGWCVLFVNSSLDNEIKDSFMIEQGSTATDYIPHEEQTYTIPTQQPMRSIGDVRDKFVKVNGNWYERHYIGRYIFTGNETFTNTGTNRFNADGLIRHIKAENLINYASNYYKASKTTRTNDEFDNLVVNEESAFNLSLSTICFTIRFKDTRFSTIQELQRWLAEKYASGNPVYVNYLLAEPLNLPCTETQIQQLENIPSTYKDFTIIQSQDETEAYLEVSGIYDLNNLINN